MTAFDALFVPADVREAVSGRSWLEAMLEFERALALDPQLSALAVERR